jgi:photosystem II stability/assembly factor-like uncharacterized protein
MSKQKQVAIMVLAIAVALAVGGGCGRRAPTSPGGSFPTGWINLSLIYNNVNAIQFIDSLEGWLAQNGGVSHTRDGGRTWQFILLKPLQFTYGVFFLGRDYGWVAGGNGFVYRTTDGGASWDGHRIIADLSFEAIYFISPMCGWVVGNFNRWEGAGSIYHTTDGGKSWVLQYHNDADVLLSVCFQDSLEGWVAGNQALTYEKLLHTTDGGKTWQQTLFNSGTGWNCLSTVTFVSHNVGFVYSELGAILKTTNGGNSWYRKAVSGDLVNNVSFKTSVSFLDASNYRVTTYGSDLNLIIKRTRNGGATWIDEINDSIACYGQPVICFTDARHGWLAGHNDSMMVYRPGPGDH